MGWKIRRKSWRCLFYCCGSTKKSLPKIKSDLADLLKKLNKPILIVIDDVDRLSSEEIKLLFQLVKANADFPNLVFLLLFDRNVVEKGLDTFALGTGGDFLEKIVQVGFDIPEVERSRLQHVLFEGLNQLLAEIAVSQRFNKQRWGNIFIPGLSPYFQTLRDVYRYLSVLSVQVSVFRNRGTFEVNPVDLFALEVLRVFEPKVYHRLPGAKNALTEQPDRQLGGQAAEDAVRKIVESIVECAPDSRRAQVREILKQLFIPAAWVFGGSHYGSDFEAGWYRDLLVCHSDVFDRYFQFAIPKQDISQADLDTILSTVGDRENLVVKLRALNKQGLLGVLLDRLEDYKEQIDLKSAVPFITGLFDIGDELPDAPPGIIWIGYDMHASRIIFHYLKREKDEAKRAAILKDAIQATTGLYLPTMNISHEVNSEERQKTPDGFLLSEENLPEFRAIGVQKIREAASSGKLVANSRMDYILYCWREWGTIDEPRKWVGELIESAEGLWTFLKAFLYRTRSRGLSDYVPRASWRISLQGLEHFVAIEILKKKVSQLSQEDLGDEEKRAIRAFQKAVRRKEQGKTEDSPWDDVEGEE